jgi:hypothetical protein
MRNITVLSLGTLLLCTSSTLAQNYGSQFYSYVNFPGENWPADPVPATSVSIGNPTGITTDAADNVYIAGPSIIFKLDPAGMLTRIAGDGHNGFSGDGGPALDAELGFPLAVAHDLCCWGDAFGNVAVDSAGNISGHPETLNRTPRPPLGCSQYKLLRKARGACQR